MSFSQEAVTPLKSNKQNSRRPPRPFSRAESESARSALSASDGRNRSLSESSRLSCASREQLKSDLYRKRKSLTVEEHHFLERLAIEGEDNEIELALEKLADEDLFFDVEEDPSQDVSGITVESSKSSLTSDENKNAATTNVSAAATPKIPKPNFVKKRSVSFSAVEIVAQSPEEDVFTSPAAAASNLAPPLVQKPILVRREGSNSSKPMNRREEQMEKRKHSWHPRMWKAHETGISVAPTTRNIFRRNSSFRRRSFIKRSSILSTSTIDLLIDGGPEQPDDIFRSTRSISSVGIGDDGDGSSVGADSMARRSDGVGGRPHFFRRTRPKRPSRVVRRESGSSIPFPPPIEHGGPVRSNSDASFPFPSRVSPFPEDGAITSPLVSPLSQRPVFPPPLQHGNPVRSNSDASFPLPPRIEAELLEADTSFESQRKDRSGSSTTFPPPILHANQIRSTSISSMSEHRLQPPAWAAPSGTPAYPPPRPFAAQPTNNSSKTRKPVVLRQSSMNEGIEVTELDININGDTTSGESNSGHQIIDSIQRARQYKSMLSAGDSTRGDFSSTFASQTISSANSFDSSINPMNRAFIVDDLRRSLTTDDIDIFDESSRFIDETYDDEDDRRVAYDDISWDMTSNGGDSQFDSWDITKYEAGYYSVPFNILGTSAADVSSLPHVLSPPLMESLQGFVPYAVSEDNFWMKYSLVRDGASLRSLLQHIRGAKYTILAVETVEGEVFGSCTSLPWRKNWNYFGNGEAFLWRLRQSRNTACNSILEQAKIETELDVFPWTGANNLIQFCTHEKIALGGGQPPPEGEESSNGSGKKENGERRQVDYGFGLAIGSELLHGTSSSCVTFGSPPLSPSHQDGSPFEIVNLEVWTFTPCMTLEEAEKLELGMLFLENHKRG